MRIVITVDVDKMKAILNQSISQSIPFYTQFLCTLMFFCLLMMWNVNLNMIWYVIWTWCLPYGAHIVPHMVAVGTHLFMPVFSYSYVSKIIFYSWSLGEIEKCDGLYLIMSFRPLCSKWKHPSSNESTHLTFNVIMELFAKHFTKSTQFMPWIFENKLRKIPKFKRFFYFTVFFLLFNLFWITEMLINAKQTFFARVFTWFFFVHHQIVCSQEILLISSSLVFFLVDFKTREWFYCS